MYNYIVLSTPTAFLCNFLHKKINSNKFAFFRIVSIIITVQRTSDNEQGRKPTSTAQATRKSENERIVPWQLYIALMNWQKRQLCVYGQSVWKDKRKHAYMQTMYIRHVRNWRFTYATYRAMTCKRWMNNPCNPIKRALARIPLDAMRYYHNKGDSRLVCARATLG